MSRALFDDPGLFLFRLDVSRGRAWFVFMSRESYRSSAFLDSRIRRRSAGGVEVQIGELLNHAPDPAPDRPCRFIFHIGHTGSTLLSRCVGELPGSHVLREPMALVDLARWADAGRAPRRFTAERWRAVRENVLSILAKTYGPGEIAVIKPSSRANGAMQETLLRPLHRALFMYCSLPTFLASMLKSEDNREDGALDLATRLRAGRGRVRAALVRRQPRARRLAALWILHMDLFLDLLPLVPESRLCSLDAEDFIAAPADSLCHLGRLFGFTWSSAQIASVVEGPVLLRDAKRVARPYDAHARRAELSVARQRWSAEIEDASVWAARVTRDRPIPDVLPRRLGDTRAA